MFECITNVKYKHKLFDKCLSSFIYKHLLNKKPKTNIKTMNDRDLLENFISHFKKKNGTVNQAAAARQLGISPAQLTHYVTGERTIGNVMRARIKAATEKLLRLGYITEDNIKQIQSVGAGTVPFLSDTKPFNISLTSLLIKDANNHVVAKAAGNSMEPTINDGDLLVVQQTETAQDTDIVLCYIDGDLSVKRFRITNGNKLLTSDNPKYNTLFLNDNNSVKLIGIVEYIIRATNAV